MTDKIVVTIHIEEEGTPVVGNALGSGDAAEDQACEREILDRLRRGDQWAWCFVIVEARCGRFVGKDTLGCCSYRDEADFRTAGGYWDDMRAEAIRNLMASMGAVQEEAREARRLLDLIAAGKVPVEVEP